MRRCKLRICKLFAVLLVKLIFQINLTLCDHDSADAASSIRPGDLIFFSTLDEHDSKNEKGTFQDAIVASGSNGSSVYHVALLKSADRIVHVKPRYGVSECSLADEISFSLALDKRLLITVMKVANQSDIVSSSALTWAQWKIGKKYNDIFSEKCTNSKGEEAYYCCQLVRKAYENAAGEPLFDIQPLNFHDSNGKIIPYWLDYFAQRNLSVPLHERGSHPSRLIQSKMLEQLLSRKVEDEKSAADFLKDVRQRFTSSTPTAYVNYFSTLCLLIALFSFQ